jgi:hypothetical protein
MITSFQKGFPAGWLKTAVPDVEPFTVVCALPVIPAGP